MVVFFDLGEDDAHDPAITGGVGAAAQRKLHQQLALRDCNITGFAMKDDGHYWRLAREGARDRNADIFAGALRRYPVVSSMTSHLDLNSLHNLSLTCKQIRSTLLPFRPQLVTQTLRCSNDAPPSPPADSPVDTDAVDADADSPILRLHPERRLAWEGMIRVGPCARDMVGGCRRCGTVVCRNCITKPLSRRFIKDRVRRLCATCVEVPIQWHTSYTAVDGGNSSGSSSGGAQEKEDHDNGPAPAFTSSAFARDPCTCEESVWLCQGCGGSLHSADVTYKRVWTWRSRYSTHIGGLGTGMGEGDQGQKCGKGENCAEATDIEVEIDCSAEVGGSDAGQRVVEGNGVFVGFGGGRQRTTTVEDDGEVEAEGPGRGWADFAAVGESFERPRAEKSGGRTPEGPGYLRQEIEGIGGVVKKKVKKRVRVGATVQEFEDERESGRYLDREEKGSLRCWCGWCDRVVPRRGEIDET
ncbi:MAG: hypothetical protein Q9160_007440 [Pyrenula sp. 1 TL-2023]